MELLGMAASYLEKGIDALNNKSDEYNAKKKHEKLTTQQHIAGIMKYGVARPNRFHVVIGLPEAIKTGEKKTETGNGKLFGSTLLSKTFSLVKKFLSRNNHEITRGLSTMVDQTEIPGKTFNTTDVNYNRDTYSIPYGVVYGVQPFTFHVSADMYEKTILDEWMSLIYDAEANAVEFWDNIVADIVIEQMDGADNVVYSVVLKDCYPTMCNPITLSNSETNTLIPLFVQFKYRKWINGEKSGESGWLKSLSQTPLGPFVTPILSNPVVQKGLDILKDNGIDLEGESLNIYKQVDDVVKNTTGNSLGKSLTVLYGIKANVENNKRISNTQKASLLDAIQKAIGALGS